MIGKLEQMLASGQDSAALRFALADHYLKNDEAKRAVEHAKVAVTLDQHYSAAWRVFGQAQAAAGLPQQAAATFERGITVAEQKGDLQVAKEMRVYLRRLQKSSGRD